DLDADPEELTDLAQNPDYADVLAMLKAEMRQVCDLEAVNAMAFADQEEMIKAYGGKAIAATIGAPSSTPPPKT
ncbi:MAG: sulfatase, partial [Sulfitobacter sp.]|nr:sulfatase [Sulfitobacter sp.]